MPDQYRDMHGLNNPLDPCGGANYKDDNGHGEYGVQRSRNAIFIVFDEGNGPLTCNYNPDAGTDTAAGSLLPCAESAQCGACGGLHDNTLAPPHAPDDQPSRLVAAALDVIDDR